MIVQVGPSGPTLGSDGALAEARLTFVRQHGVKLPGLLAPSLVRRCQERIAAAPVRVRLHDELDPPARDLEVLDAVLHDELLFLLNDDGLLEVIARVTGIEPLGHYACVVRSHIPGEGHDDTWHSDVGDDNVLTMSVNLSRGLYRGGRVQLRENASQRVTFDETVTGAGDALVFEIAKHLQHRVTEMEGDTTRTVLSGWFRSRPSYRDRLRARFADAGGDLP